MATFLFNDIIFGPVKSRRLGISLGINLLPVDKKFCNFDCLYCECGWTCNNDVSSSDLPSREIVKDLLCNKILEMKQAPDVITFAGNGEPTIHPDFPGIIDDTLDIRDRLCKNARIAVLSNSTNLDKRKITEALKKIDQPILKLDTAIEESYQLINRPRGKSSINTVIDHLSDFGEGLIIQTLFFKGSFKGKLIDNSTDSELDKLFLAYKKISPSKIMIYTFERDTPLESLEKISLESLNEIGRKLESMGFVVEISG